eukprot:886414-Ditylum_brightwellii.AAC.1
MPHLRPLRARLSNLNHKGGHAKGDPPKKSAAQKGAKKERHLQFLEGRHQPVLHIDKGNATCDL